MALDPNLKKTALDYATKLYDNIQNAFHNPLVKLEGEDAKIFELFNEWGFFTDLKLEETGNKDETIKFLAMYKYKILIGDKLLLTPKPKRSKWEVVTGQKLKR
jgi:hypothetical protein